MKKVMKEPLFKYCQNNLRVVGQGKLKITPSLKCLHRDYNFGSLDDKYCYFTEQDKDNLIEHVKDELQVHLFRQSYPDKNSRTKNAENSRNEKINALKVSENFVLVNSLNSLCINQQKTDISLLGGLGHFIYAPDIKTVEHQQIILVENLEVMANLSLLNIPDQLKDALWLYRGDKEKHKQTGTAGELYKRFQKTNTLICFSDFDPTGLAIALTCGATQWLTLSSSTDIHIKLSGAEYEWFNQQKDKTFLNNSAKLTDQLSELFDVMNHNQKTLKQEHMLAHSLELALYPLS